MATLSATKSSRRGRVAALTRAVRAGERSQSELDDARRALAEAQIHDYVEKILGEAPPLTAEQRERIAALLRAGGVA